MGRSIGGISTGYIRDRGGLDFNFIIIFSLFFLVFHGVGGVGGKIAIYQQIWGIGGSGSRILGGSVVISSLGESG